jgi:hypothetical protein
MKGFKFFAAAVICVFTANVAFLAAGDCTQSCSGEKKASVEKVSNKECSTMKKASAKECSAEKVSAKECSTEKVSNKECSTMKKASAKEGCCPSKAKEMKVENKEESNEAKKGNTTAEAKPESK